MSLREYSRKRDFEKTAEPKGQGASGGTKHRFVIQKHAASRLHYDFRLEIGGALKSWAVPKGIPYAKGEKRLAVQVEDHPVSYIDFEGTIPKGQYGGGTVMVWDRGTFEPLSKSPAIDLASGKLHFVLQGKKLHGEWYLIRLRDQKQWLLIKGGDALRPVSTKLDDTSALSGKTMKELAKGDRVWHSNHRPDRPSSRSAVKESETSLPKSFIEPMKARLVESPPKGNWIYEIKFDGFRAMALKDDGGVRLLSRNEKDFGSKFPEVLDSIAKIRAHDAIIDGEIVALDSEGRSSFQLLQAHALGAARPSIFFYAFDLLQLNGKDLRAQPVTSRKAQLEKLLNPPPGVIRYSASLGAKVTDLLKQAHRLGLEGLIGKRENSIYESGQRSGAWIKLKLHREQEMVIGGYTEPAGTRKYFGAILVGYYQKHELRFAGKVGTGFNEALLKRLHSQFKLLSREDCPFVDLPEKRSGRYGQGITATEMKRCHWVEPKLVCQIKFSEWTRDGKLRHPVFLGLREDKEAEEVVRETAA
jgi:bifunctional non-homologous end joining protein LigD